MRRSSYVFAALVAVGAAAVPAFALTAAEKCAQGVASAGRKYFDQRLKAIGGCQDKEAAGSGGPCAPTDPAVAPALAKARASLEKVITAKCAGGVLAQIDLGTPCVGLATPTLVADCIADDSHGPVVDRLITTIYDGVGAIADPAQLLCQKSIGKAARKDAGARQKAREKCEKKRVAGAVDICPDAKTLATMDKQRLKLIDAVEKRCPLMFAAEPSPDLDFGFPCESFELVTFDRVPATNNNAMPVATRLARCLASVTAVDADTAAAVTLPGTDAAPFTYGVTAGDATDSSFVVWTRTDAPGVVSLEVSRFDSFNLLVRPPDLIPTANDNTAKLDITGLMADTQYYYRFKQGADVSRTGRIRTAPLPSTAQAFTFGWSGDANAFYKPYSVLEGMTNDNPDLFMYIGDTIYSDDPRSGTGVATTIGDYYVKYRENRDDRPLRDLMAAVGTFTMWDDHEVTNDFYGSPFGAFGPQIIAGNQAFRDYMPIREDGGDPMKLYRTVRWGQLAEFFLLDCRQYRDPQAYVTEPACLSAGEPTVTPNAACTTEINNPARQYLGAAQTAWLKNALLTSTAKWKFVMNGPLLSQLIFLPYDRWEGYGAARNDILEFINFNAIPNVIFLSTDIHAAIVNDGVVNTGPSGGSVREIVAGAIGMDPIFRELPPSILGLVGSLPSIFGTISYFDIDRRNYVLADVGSTQATFTYRDNAGTILKTVIVPAN
ncbi:MAG TPA: alkaline phosphatase D family protein [Candidatus Binatia bacterium]|jgi:phosphodiesterase/alkaline phosphatase D-like protein|nr:alkaline phosphatase D family protein [Candidatus Binatia bacterium]